MSDTNVVYTKVDEQSPEVQQLAAATGSTPKSIAALINQDRYRRAYNRVKQSRDKVMREFFRSHPELLPKSWEVTS